MLKNVVEIATERSSPCSASGLSDNAPILAFLEQNMRLKTASILDHKPYTAKWALHVRPAATLHDCQAKINLKSLT